jgi:hypothetical protein
MSKSRVKLPKRIAGVKVPKAIRKGPIMDFVNSSAGQMLLMEALVAAGSLFAVKSINQESMGETLSHPIDSLQRAGRTLGNRADDSRASVARNSARLQFALTEAVRAFRAALADPSQVPAMGEPPAVFEPETEGSKKRGRQAPDPSAPH